MPKIYRTVNGVRIPATKQKWIKPAVHPGKQPKKHPAKDLSPDSICVFIQNGFPVIPSISRCLDPIPASFKEINNVEDPQNESN